MTKPPKTDPSPTRGRPKKNRVWTYKRYSSSAQDGGVSIEFQDESIQKYCRENDLLPDREFIARAESASKGLNITFRKMFEAAYEENPYAIVCYDMTRWGRHLEFEIAEYKLDRRGIKVFYANQEFSDDAYGNFTKKIIRAVGELMPQVTAKRVKPAQDYCTRQGWSVGGPVSDGYKKAEIPDPDGKTVHGVPKKRYVYVPDDQPGVYDVTKHPRCEYINTLFRMYAAGSSLPEIMHHLHRVGFRKKKSAKPIDMSTLLWALKNRAYIGEMTRAGVSNPNSHEPLIDLKTFEYCQKLLNERKRKNKDRKGTRTGTGKKLLSGLLRCSSCGSYYVWNQQFRFGRDYSFYECGSNSRFKSRICDSKNLNAGRTEKKVIERTVAKILSVDFFQEAAESYNQKVEDLQRQITPDLDEIEDQIRTLDRELANLTQVIAGGAPSKHLFKEISAREVAKEVLEARLEEIKALNCTERTTVKEHLAADYIKEKARILNHGNLPEKRSVLHSLLLKIIVYPDRQLDIIPNLSGILTGGDEPSLTNTRINSVDLDSLAVLSSITAYIP